MQNWLQTARRPEVVGRALRVSLLVGTLLVLINQGDTLINGNINVTVILKILLTYCVPYGVSTYSGVAAIRDQSGD